ncbi:hypothetical protein [Embleya sp. NBC_00896]|uniref:hypothetical protein n=1 Tax=Embleya sp. NBC_00896 TaxID=2975961 RepID=UPI003865B87E|nr:hypothetical protein OG928_23310 [Embleya sp. NBC_00896]
MSILRGASCADAVRVLATAAVSGAAATILLCLLGWARATGRGGPAVAGPLLAALPVLATVGVLTAVGTRLAVLHRIDRTAVPHSVDVPVRRIRGLAASEAVATALVGAIAGVQAHLVVRALLGSAPAPIRRLLAEGTGVPWVGLVAVLAVVPAIAGPAAAFAVHLPSRRLLPRIPPYLGPLLVLAGLLAQYLIADPARPGELPRGALPAAVSGYGAVLVGAALTVPWFVTWIGTGWAARAGRAWSLCAARRIEASARGLALPLGLATIALAVVTTTRFAGVHTPVRMRDAPLFLTIATVSLCAAAILFLVTVEYGSARRETSRTLHALGATAPVDRRAALAALTVPVLVCAVTAVAVGALAAWPAREGSPFPTVSTGTATLGTVWAIVLLASAVICAGFVILRDERPRRRERA